MDNRVDLGKSLTLPPNCNNDNNNKRNNNKSSSKSSSLPPLSKLILESKVASHLNSRKLQDSSNATSEDSFWGSDLEEELEEELLKEEEAGLADGADGFESFSEDDSTDEDIVEIELRQKKKKLSRFPPRRL